MKLPKQFKVTYEAAECGGQIEMFNCLVPGLHIKCEDCNETHYYASTLIEHKTWEWDRIEAIEEELDRLQPA